MARTYDPRIIEMTLEGLIYGTPRGHWIDPDDPNQFYWDIEIVKDFFMHTGNWWVNHMDGPCQLDVTLAEDAVDELPDVVADKISKPVLARLDLTMRHALLVAFKKAMEYGPLTDEERKLLSEITGDDHAG